MNSYPCKCIDYRGGDNCTADWGCVWLYGCRVQSSCVWAWAAAYAESWPLSVTHSADEV